MKQNLHLNTTNSNFQCNHNECSGDDCCSDGDRCNPSKSLKTELIKVNRNVI